MSEGEVKAVSVTDQERMDIISAFWEGYEIEERGLKYKASKWKLKTEDIWDFTRYEYRHKLAKDVLYINFTNYGGCSVYHEGDEALSEVDDNVAQPCVKYIKVTEEIAKALNMELDK